MVCSKMNILGMGGENTCFVSDKLNIYQNNKCEMCFRCVSM